MPNPTAPQGTTEELAALMRAATNTLQRLTAGQPLTPAEAAFADVVISTAMRQGPTAIDRRYLVSLQSKIAVYYGASPATVIPPG